MNKTLERRLNILFKVCPYNLTPRFLTDKSKIFHEGQSGTNEVETKFSYALEIPTTFLFLKIFLKIIRILSMKAIVLLRTTTINRTCSVNSMQAGKLPHVIKILYHLSIYDFVPWGKLRWWRFTKIWIAQGPRFDVFFRKFAG